MKEQQARVLAALEDSCAIESLNIATTPIRQTVCVINAPAHRAWRSARTQQQQPSKTSRPCLAI
jgi:hypothetical protein